MPTRLMQIHRATAEGKNERYLELAKDREECDLHYAAVLSTRKLAILQLPITVLAATRKRLACTRAFSGL